MPALQGRQGGSARASAPARIVNVASGAHQTGRIDFADVQGTQRYSGWRAYCQSKLANVMFTYTLAARLQGLQVTANVLHPGFVATRFAHNNRGLFARLIRLAQVAALSPEQGAETMVYLATAPEVAEVSGSILSKSGRCARPRRRMTPPRPNAYGA